MLIAICEDEQIYSDGLSSLCRKWETMHQNIPLIIHTYSTPEALLNAHECPLDYDLFFLDILFAKASSMNGYRLAELIREHNLSSVIVFTTNSKDYDQYGYYVSAYRYLLKPVSGEDVFDCLDYCSRYSLSGSAAFLPVLKKDGISRLRLKDIILIESGPHTVRIHTLDKMETVHIHENFETYIQSIPEEWFVRVQRGLLVNVQFITKFTKDTVHLISGENYKIGRQYRKVAYEQLYYFFVGGTL